jgi:PAS domain S-box-containing protein
MDKPATRELALEAEIRQLREQLDRLEEQFRTKQSQLVDSQRLAQVGSWERDPATGKVLWSDEMYRIYGLPKGSRVEFQTFLSRVHPKEVGIILEAAKKILTNTPLRVEYRIIRPDGEMRYIRSISEQIPGDEGTPARIAGTDQDITEQVQAMERLRESEQRVRLAVSAGVGLWDHNLSDASVRRSQSHGTD